MTQFVLLNGPPSSGKDTAARELIEYFTFSHMKFAAPIKRMACALLNCDMRWLEENKDKPCKFLFKGNYAAPADEQHMTPRQLLIELSEQFFKPRFGEDVFGRWLWQEASQNGAKLVLVTDSGFAPEAERVIRNAGQKNVILVRLHRMGCTYLGDSRDYLPNGLCITYDIHNDQSLFQFTMLLLRIVQRHFNPRLLREPTWIK